MVNWEPGELERLRVRLGDVLCRLLWPNGDGAVSEELLRARMNIAGSKLSALLSSVMENDGGHAIQRRPDGVAFGQSWKDGCRNRTRPWAVT